MRVYRCPTRIELLAAVLLIEDTRWSISSERRPLPCTYRFETHDDRRSFGREAQRVLAMTAHRAGKRGKGEE